MPLFQRVRTVRKAKTRIEQFTLIVIRAILFFSSPLLINAQDCNENLASIYGSALNDERGHVIISTSSEDIYVAGTKDDSTLLLKTNAAGFINWVHLLDVVSGGEYPTGLLLDSDGMLAVLGTVGINGNGAGIYLMRFDPVSKTILWTHQYQYSQSDYSFGIIEKENGNYVLSAQTTFSFPAHEDAIIFEVNKADGLLIPGLSRSYSLGGTETLFDIAYHNNFIYGVGRYKDGLSASRFRNTIVKLDADSGNQIWARFGHVPNSNNARLYGSDLIIDNGYLMSLYSGDPNGSSTANTLMYLQKTDLDGNLIWVKEYDMPGPTDLALDLARVEDGYIILAHKRLEGQYVLFKTNTEGDILWSKAYILESHTNPLGIIQGSSLLAISGDYIFFTGYGADASYNQDMVLARINMDGVEEAACIQTIEIEVQERELTTAVFYSNSPIEEQIQYNVVLRNPLITPIELMPGCLFTLPDTIVETITVYICKGEIYEGYTASGMYSDSYVTVKGCDSMRILHLIVANPEKFSNVTLCSGEHYENYTQSGMYIDTLHGSLGECDTVRYLNLSFISKVETIIDTTICDGQNFLGYHTSGLHLDTFKTMKGCDSIRILDLNVTNFIYDDELISICKGEIYHGYSAAGIYIDSFQSVFGCDSIVRLSLTVEDLSYSHIIQHVCFGFFSDYTTPGYYVDTLVSLSGCDSIRTLELLGGPEYIPNVFTPNNDGINDFFFVSPYSSQPLSLHYFALFDRFGDMVYQTESWPVRWDGNDLQKSPYQSGVYAYIFVYSCGGNRIVEHGDVTLLR